MKKMIVTVLAILALVIVVILIMASFRPNEYSIERQVTINKPTQVVFDYIKLLKNEKYYSKWVMADPNAKMEYTGIDGTAGCIASWDSQNKNVGKGEQEIKRIVEGERIEKEIRFKKPFEATSDATFITEPVSGNQTKVTWIFHGANMTYMMKLMHMVINLQKMLGNDMQTSLDTLKDVLEKQ